MTDLIKDFWQILMAAIAALIFIIRMEGRTAQHGREIERLQAQRDADMVGAQRSRNETHAMLHDMNAKLDRLIERNLR